MPRKVELLFILVLQQNRGTRKLENIALMPHEQFYKPFLKPIFNTGILQSLSAQILVKVLWQPHVGFTLFGSLLPFTRIIM